MSLPKAATPVQLAAGGRSILPARGLALRCVSCMTEGVGKVLTRNPTPCLGLGPAPLQRRLAPATVVAHTEALLPGASHTGRHHCTTSGLVGSDTRNAGSSLTLAHRTHRRTILGATKSTAPAARSLSLATSAVLPGTLCLYCRLCTTERSHTRCQPRLRLAESTDQESERYRGRGREEER